MSDGGNHGGSRGAARSTPGWVLLLATTIWFVLWYLTPGLHPHGLGGLVTSPVTAILVETIAASVIVVAITLCHGRYNRLLFARSKQVGIYLLPAVLALALPLHYALPLPLLVYMVWMTVSAFWQDYLTFGLLQNYIGERLSSWATTPIVATVFYLGHALLLPDRFAPPHWLPALGILGMGVACSLVRAQLRTLHVVLALHLAFYFVFA